MEPSDSSDWRAWLRAFLRGPYRGAPVDYLMAIAIVFAMIAVVGAGIVRKAVAEIAAGLGDLVTFVLVLLASL